MSPISRLGVALLAGAALFTAPRRPAAQSDSLDLVVAATTDVHGRVRGWDYYTDAPDSARGLTRAATIVDSLRATNPERVLLVDAGDLLEGNPFTYLASRRRDAVHPVIAAMNVMRYDAAAIGNHEFNYGVPFLRRAIGGARFALLAANAFTPNGAHAFPGWRIVSRAGVRIGIVGATTPGSDLWDRDNLRGRLVIRDIVPAVRDAVAAAHKAGADIVVVLLHSGLDEPASYDTVATGLPSENVAARVAHDVPGIDLIVYGHSHERMADTIINGVLMMQPKNWAASVGVAHLMLHRDRTTWRVARSWSSLVPAAGHAESRAVLAATARAHQATVSYVTTPIGRTAVRWRGDSARVADTPLIDFVLDVERRTAHTDLASTAAFTLDASLDTGAITIAQVARLYPYDNTLEAIRISGAQLREYLEFSARYFGRFGTGEPPVDPRIPGYNFDIVSGATYTIDVSRPVGSRIVGLAVRGKPATAADTFTLALNNYRQAGGGGYAMIRGAPVVYDGQVELRQLLIDAVRQRGDLEPSMFAQRNWSVVPAPAVARAYAAMQRPFEQSASTAGVARLRIIATNDFHGALDPVIDDGGAARGGASAMAAAVERDARECPRPCATLLVDAGDLFQGSVASNLSFGRPVVSLYDDLGYAATAVGNHEFDWSTDTLRARMREARFAILGANVRARDGQPLPWLRADTIVERGGVRVGIIGVIGPETYTSIIPNQVRDVRFTDPAPVIDSLTRALRASGARIVIVLAHSGAFCSRDGSSGCHGAIIDLAGRLSEHVDAIVSGHTHSLVDTRVHGVPIVQARSSGRAVAVVDLALPPGGGAATVLAQRVDDVTPGGASADASADSIVRAADARVAGLEQRPVARLAEALPRDGTQYPLGNLIADAQRWAGKADVAAVNNGGIRQNLAAGVVTWGELFAVQPFDNALQRFTVPGSALRAYLEHLVDGSGPPRTHVSGVTITYDSLRAPGHRITAVRLATSGELRDDGRYTIVLNDFMATGRDGVELASAAAGRETLASSDLDALTSYLSSRPQPVAVPHDHRIIATSQ